MSSLIVPVTTIEALNPHGNADALELAQILGWQIVVRKGEYQVGDKIVYFPIDTLLPLELSDRLNVTKYLSKQRIRCAKLRGEPSFGLAIRPDQDWPVGENVADFYGVKRYEPPVRVTAGDAEVAHPLFVAYTEIEHMRNFPHTFHPGEPVLLSEKIHGCLDYRTKITMADGTGKRIMDINPGEYVLGVDKDGFVVPAQVLNVFNNGTAEKWLTVTGKRKLAGRGHHFWAVHCTPNHRFWCPEKQAYIPAETLLSGDKVMILRNEMSLTPLQEQVLIGKMLGDATLRNFPERASVEWGQKAAHEAYIDWTLQALGDIAGQRKANHISGYGTDMIRVETVCNVYIKELFKDWVDGEVRKHIPAWVAEKIGPIALAFWYMDDGSLGHQEDQEDRAHFAVCAFSEGDCEVLIHGFHKFGINVRLYWSGSHARFRLNADEAEKLFLLIAPYIPPVMQYKLPERYRGHAGWLPSSANQYKPLLVEQAVEQVYENETIKSSRYDIETETHNFFANGILVHNSQCRLASIEGELMAGSKQVRRKRPEGDHFASSTYWFPFTQEPVRILIEKLASKHRQVILFGEVYGSKIQSFHYGFLGTLGFRAFDLLLDGHYVDWPDFLELCAQYNVEAVPALATIPFDLGEVKRYSEGKTQLMEADAHIREGVVVRPVHERHDPRVGRVILKYVSDSYLFGEKSDYTDV